ncbi:unnamed protein product [Orchesella dallaii]|uniref:LEM domain-containing protein n=1 Tax=Orchesella dallaii TaxID=48710 RepID=A0ABP1S138_9HEXA
MFICDDPRLLVLTLRTEDQRGKWADQLSNRNLFDVLMACNLTVGPVVDSTRSLYRKKLIDLLKTRAADQIVDSINHYLGINPEALEEWEAAGMRQFGSSEEGGHSSKTYESQETEESRYSFEAATYDRCGTLNRAGALSYAAVVNSSASDEIDMEVKAGLTPRSPTKSRTRNDVEIEDSSTHGMSLSNGRSQGGGHGHDNRQGSSSFRSKASELFTSLRKRENRVCPNSPRKAESPGSGAVGKNLSRNNGSSKLVILGLAAFLGLSVLIGLMVAHFMRDTGDIKEPIPDIVVVQDELDVVLDYLENAEGGEV